MKVKGLSNLDGPTTPHIFLPQSFRWICFTVLPRLVFSRSFDIGGNLGNAKEKPPVHWLKKSDYSSLSFTLPEYFLSWSVPLSKMKTNYSYLSFYCNSEEKQFWKGILGRKSHCIMIRGKFRTLPKISHRAFVQKYSTANRDYLFLQKALS